MAAGPPGLRQLIQRLPAGLLNVLNIFGGLTPKTLADDVHGSLELLQYYGLTQKQFAFTVNAATAVNGNVDCVPSSSSWCVLFAANAAIVQTATMTAWALDLNVQRNQNAQTFATREGSIFGATTAGARSCPFVAPYPLLLPPASIVRASLKALGTDATASVTVTAEFGVLG